MRRITIILFAALVLAAVSAGCTANENGGTPAGKTILNAASKVLSNAGEDDGPSSRAGWNPIDRGHWHAGDRIAVADVETRVRTPFTLHEDGGNLFTGDVIYGEGTDVIGSYPDDERLTITIDVYYGYSQSATFSIPSKQTYTQGGIKEMPMVGRSVVSGNEIDMAFHHLYTLVRIPIVIAPDDEAETMVVKSLSLMRADKSNKDIWGDMKASLNTTDNVTAPLVKLNNDYGAKKGSIIDLDCGEGVEITKGTPTDFYIAVRPQEYPEGLELRLKVEGMIEGQVRNVTMTNPGPFDFSQSGAIYTMKTLTFRTPHETVIHLTAERLREAWLAMYPGQSIPEGILTSSVSTIGIDGALFRCNTLRIDGDYMRMSRYITDIATLDGGPIPGDITRVVYSVKDETYTGVSFSSDPIVTVKAAESTPPGTYTVYPPNSYTPHFMFYNRAMDADLEYLDIYYYPKN